MFVQCDAKPKLKGGNEYEEKSKQQIVLARFLER